MRKKEQHRIRLSVGLTLILSMLPMWLCAQRKADTIRTYEIPEVTVTERYGAREVRAAAPTQLFTKAQLEKMSALQLSDAVKYFAGVTVKDYGGIGGLKTVSLRSLGAEHTVISYDGVAVTNTQTGQVDIGRFSLDNVDRLSLSNGQNDRIFQPARMFAAAGVLNIETLTPRFEQGKSTRFTGRVKSGSWGLINPSLRVEQQLTKKWIWTADTEWMSADGRYKYTLHYGDAGDLTSREKRKNTEVRTLRAETELFGNFSDKEQWRTKLYYYQSSRGLPGATTFYYDYASQHLWDKIFFAQSHYKKEYSPKWAFQASAKWNWSYQRYLDPDYKGSTGKTENNYYQQEYYLTTSMLYRAMGRLSFTLSTDGSVQTLRADLNDFSEPTRYSWLTALAGKYVDERFTLTGSLLATAVNEHVRYGTSGDSHRRLSPYLSVAFKPFNEELRVRLFYKDIFRMPTFNDLYYLQVGNTGLIPEKTKQYNLGLTYLKELDGILPYFSITADAYYNKVRDKIIAIPTKNIFIWSMVNLGEVDIKGVDVAANLTLAPSQDVCLLLSANGTYQRAQDMTDPEGKTYKHQIAYTPKFSGSGQLAVEMPWVNISYALLHAGSRYVLGQNNPQNRLNSYTDHSIGVYRDFNVKRVKLLLKADLLNLFDKNYEVVRYFPMPGRSFRVTAGINY